MLPMHINEVRRWPWKCSNDCRLLTNCGINSLTVKKKMNFLFFSLLGKKKKEHLEILREVCYGRYLTCLMLF